jgi:hypothetical protein
VELREAGQRSQGGNDHDRLPVDDESIERPKEQHVEEWQRWEVPEPAPVDDRGGMDGEQGGRDEPYRGAEEGQPEAIDEIDRDDIEGTEECRGHRRVR